MKMTTRILAMLLALMMALSVFAMTSCANTSEDPEESQEGTQPGDTYTINGRGIPNKTNPSMRGSHTVRFVVEVPTRLNEAQKNKLREFEASLSDKNYDKRRGFFDWFKKK